MAEETKALLVNEHQTVHRAASTSWPTSASLIVANMLGAGVLGLPNAVKGMGITTSIILMVIVTTMSIYGGLLLGWVRDTRPIRTYADLASHCGARISAAAGVRWRQFVVVVAYSYIIGACTIYLTTVKISYMEIFQKCDTSNTTIAAVCDQPACSSMGVTSLSSTAWLCISVLSVFPLIHFRSLSDAGFVSYVGVLTIAIVNVIIVVRCVISDVKHDQPPERPYDRSFRDVINGLTSLAFAYGGHVLMPDIQSEMKDPMQFPKAVWFSQFFLFLNYALVGYLGYLTFGGSVTAPITMNLPHDGLGVFTNVCLLLHVMVAYCINSTVLTRAICDSVWPGLLGTGPRARRVALRWGMVSTSILLVCGLVALLVPFFSDLMNVWSSVGIFTLSFAVPSALYLMANHLGPKKREEEIGRTELSSFAVSVNVIIIIIAVAGAGLGIWAAIADIADKWSQCDFSLKF